MTREEAEKFMFNLPTREEAELYMSQVFDHFEQQLKEQSDNHGKEIQKLQADVEYWKRCVYRD